jgi:ribose 5-phosphate isomerase
MDKIKDSVINDGFKIINFRYNSNEGRFVTDKRKVLFAEVKSKNIDDPEEYEEELLEYRDFFDKVFFKSRVRGEDYYLYEVYIDGVDQNYK